MLGHSRELGGMLKRPYNFRSSVQYEQYMRTPAPTKNTYNYPPLPKQNKNKCYPTYKELLKTNPEEVTGYVKPSPETIKVVEKPTYSAYDFITKEKNFKICVDDIISKTSNKTKIVFLANPNNPTGTYLTEIELIELRKKLRKDILLVVDDAYAEYMKNHDYKSGLDLFKKKENVFILRTFSKIYGLSSLRIGWGYGSKKIIKSLNIITVSYTHLTLPTKRIV